MSVDFQKKCITGETLEEIINAISVYVLDDGDISRESWIGYYGDSRDKEVVLKKLPPKIKESWLQILFDCRLLKMKNCVLYAISPKYYKSVQPFTSTSLIKDIIKERGTGECEFELFDDKIALWEGSRGVEVSMAEYSINGFVVGSSGLHMTFKHLKNISRQEYDELPCCAYCGNKIYTEFEIYRECDKDRLLCHDHIGYKECSACGSFHRESELQDGLCEWCYDMNFSECKICGKKIDMRLQAHKEIDGHIVCKPCVRKLPKCEKCGKPTVNRHKICDDCQSKYFVTCDKCGKLVECDLESHQEGNAVCQSCMDDKFLSQINNYYDKPIPVFSNPKNRETQLHIGFELEIDMENFTGGDEEEPDEGDCTFSRETALATIKKYIGDKRLYCKRDGSLGEYGIEIISQPNTFEALQKLELKKMFAELLSGNYRSHSTTSCGLHFHADRKYLGTKAVQNLTIMLNNNYDYMIDISRRTGRNRGRWCNQNMLFSDCKVKLDAVKKAKQTFKQIDKSKDYNRHTIINLQNASTVEFRFFKGTLNYDTFMLSAKFIYEICEIAKSLSEWKAFDFRNWYNLLSENVQEFVTNKCKRTKYIISEEK